MTGGGRLSFIGTEFAPLSVSWYGGALAPSQVVYCALEPGVYANTVGVTGVEYDPVATNNTFVWNVTIN